MLRNLLILICFINLFSNVFCLDYENDPDIQKAIQNTKLLDVGTRVIFVFSLMMVFSYYIYQRNKKKSN